jgi:hypothetical protein
MDYAHGMIVAAEAGMEGARALLPEVADALFSLEGQSLESRLSPN